MMGGCLYFFLSLLEIFKAFNQIYNWNLELKIVIQIY